MKVLVPQINREWADEIIVVDGGSTDGTVEFAQSQGLRVLAQSKRGYGQGIAQALQIATGEIVVEFMTDGASIPADIPRIIAKVREGYDLVIASRYFAGAKSDDDDWLTGFGNWLFTTVVNILFVTKYTDVLTGFRAYRRSKALQLKFDAVGLSWPCQLSIRFARAGFRVTDIGANEPARIGGVRKMHPLKTGWEITKLIVRDFVIFNPPKNARKDASCSAS
jgi:glycosyltransferase involved in cell wall biosynthesis